MGNPAPPRPPRADLRKAAREIADSFPGVSAWLTEIARKPPSRQSFRREALRRVAEREMFDMSRHERATTIARIWEMHHPGDTSTALGPVLDMLAANGVKPVKARTIFDDLDRDLYP